MRICLPEAKPTKNDNTIVNLSFSKASTFLVLCVCVCMCMCVCVPTLNANLLHTCKISSRVGLPSSLFQALVLLCMGACPHHGLFDTLSTTTFFVIGIVGLARSRTGSHESEGVSAGERDRCVKGDDGEAVHRHAHTRATHRHKARRRKTKRNATMKKRNTHAHAITQHTRNTRKHTHPYADGAGGVREVSVEARNKKAGEEKEGEGQAAYSGQPNIHRHRRTHSHDRYSAAPLLFVGYCYYFFLVW